MQTLTTFLATYAPGVTPKVLTAGKRCRFVGLVGWKGEMGELEKLHGEPALI